MRPFLVGAPLALAVRTDDDDDDVVLLDAAAAALAPRDWLRPRPRRAAAAVA